MCAASAAANAMSCAARLARTAARTAASPAPRPGSLTPGAASLTAESAQASLSPCRPASACKDAWPTAELPASQRASRTAAWKAGVRASPSASRWVATRDPGPLDAGQGVGGNPRQVGIRRRSRRRRRRAARRASDASRRVSPEGSRSEPSARASPRLAASSSSARASNPWPLPRSAGSWSIPATTAADSPAQDRSAGPAGAAPPNRGSSLISASRASCAVSAVPSPASRPATSPSGTASRASPARSRCRSAGPAAPVRSAAQSSTAPARASPASARRSATRVLTAGSAVQASTLVASMTGSVSPRCAAATAPSAWSRVSTPPGAGGHPSGGAAVSSPVAIVPVLAPRRSARAPPRWRRSAAGPRPTGPGCAAGAIPGG